VSLRISYYFTPWLLSLLLVAGLGTAPPLSAQRGEQPERSPDELRQRLAELAEHYAPLESAFELAAELVRPSVVAVASVRQIEQRSPFGRGPLEDFFRGDPFFERFFGDEPAQRRAQGLGSGVLIDDTGHILTNHHVIDRADELTVRFWDGREYDATVIGTDEHTDLAVIRIDTDGLPEGLSPARLGDSDQVRVGHFVLAIGSPFGLEQTVTAGVVSSMGRALNLTRYEDFIQTDTAINRGNSGGPLVNLRGDVVGINTAILSHTGGYQGIGLAISSNMARYVAESLIDTGRVVRGWLGVDIQPLTPEMARTFGYDRTDGAVIANVMPDSPAEAGGLESGDIVTSIDGEEITDTRDLQMKVARLRPGEDVEFTVWRSERRGTVTVRIGEMPDDLAAARPTAPARDPGALGLELSDLTPELRQQLRLPAELDGTLVTNVVPGSPAHEAGLRRGHVVLDIAGRTPADAREAAAMIRNAAADGVRLRVRAGDRTMFLVLRQR
jgi:serine protease Do